MFIPWILVAPWFVVAPGCIIAPFLIVSPWLFSNDWYGSGFRMDPRTMLHSFVDHDWFFKSANRSNYALSFMNMDCRFQIVLYGSDRSNYVWRSMIPQVVCSRCILAMVFSLHIGCDCYLVCLTANPRWQRICVLDHRGPSARKNPLNCLLSPFLHF